jgi:TRAP-type mannitol/chloroaromatic compound transport system permease small subunit
LCFGVMVVVVVYSVYNVSKHTWLETCRVSSLPHHERSPDPAVLFPCPVPHILFVSLHLGLLQGVMPVVRCIKSVDNNSE